METFPRNRKHQNSNLMRSSIILNKSSPDVIQCSKFSTLHFFNLIPGHHGFNKDITNRINHIKNYKDTKIKES